MWSRDTYAPGGNYFVEEHFKVKTSSLVPRTPNIHFLTLNPLHLADLIIFHFTSNVAVDDVSTFVSFFIVKTKFAPTESLCFFFETFQVFEFK